MTARMVAVLLAGMAAASPLAAGVELDEQGKVELSADFRLRFEADWDSQTADGRQRRDRNRLRARARIGLKLAPRDGLEIGVRLRSGAEQSHQSPHVTLIDFDGNDTGAADFRLDKWYLKAARRRSWAWAGRNGLPFWRQTEMAFDDDVTAVGVGAGGAWEGQAGRLTLAGGYFSMPVGMTAFTGNLAGVQAAWQREAGGLGLTLAAGLVALDADPDDPDAARLLNGNGFRDYRLWLGSLQLRTARGGLPLTFGADLAHNAESYSADDPDPFTAANFDQTDGWLVFGRAGSLASPGDWLAAWYYLRVETLAVHASYSHDDWVRWGSATEGRATNMRGHELRLAYRLSGSANLVARLFLVEAITTGEDGNRLRVDLNYAF